MAVFEGEIFTEGKMRRMCALFTMTMSMVIVILLSLLVCGTNSISETEQTPVCVADTWRNVTAHALAIELQYEALTSVADFDIPLLDVTRDSDSSEICTGGEANATTCAPVHGPEYEDEAEDMQALGKSGKVLIEAKLYEIDLETDEEHGLDERFDSYANDEGEEFFESDVEDGEDVDGLYDEEYGLMYDTDEIEDGDLFDEEDDEVLGIEDDEGFEDDDFEIDDDGDEEGLDDFGDLGVGEDEDSEFDEPPVSMGLTDWNGFASETYTRQNGTMYADMDMDLEE